jgi:hypothetical protein
MSVQERLDLLKEWSGAFFFAVKAKHVKELKWQEKKAPPPGPLKPRVATWIFA